MLIADSSVWFIDIELPSQPNRRGLSLELCGFAAYREGATTVGIIMHRRASGRISAAIASFPQTTAQALLQSASKPARFEPR